MALHMISGVLGSGKGRHSVRITRKWLHETDTPIVGNFAWEVGPWVDGTGRMRRGWRSYFEHVENNSKLADSVGDRIFKLSDDDTAEFFLYRAIPNENVPKVKTSEIIKRGRLFTLCKAAAIYKVKVDKETGVEEKRLISFDTELLGLGAQNYMIDEAWKFWNAREWSSTSKAFVYYAAHSRKTGDDVYLATQAIKDIDASIVRKMQDFHVMVNLSKRQYGVFRQPDKIIAKVYSIPPATKDDQPMRTIEYDSKADPVDDCFDTTGGIALGGRMVGDLNEKKPGINFKLLYVGAAMVPITITILLWYTFHYLNHKAGAMVHRELASVQPHATDTNTLANNIVQSFVDNGKRAAEHMYGQYDRVEPGVPETNAVPELVSGYCILSGVPYVYTTAGEEYTASEIRGISTHQVTLMDGRVLKWYKPKDYEIGNRFVNQGRPFDQADMPMPASEAGSTVQVTPAIGGQGNWDPSFHRQFPSVRNDSPSGFIQ